MKINIVLIILCFATIIYLDTNKNESCSKIHNEQEFLNQTCIETNESVPKSVSYKLDEFKLINKIVDIDKMFTGYLNDLIYQLKDLPPEQESITGYYINAINPSLKSIKESLQLIMEIRRQIGVLYINVENWRDLSYNERVQMIKKFDIQEQDFGNEQEQATSEFEVGEAILAYARTLY
jgi:hypothetical protein